ncbi:MAG TPA: cyclic pyranopterin monophosphate synthase MoaC [Candidatus Tectomicrobia bacterium]|nr:cyclic pyranopterin monophosphate synthase MoaC [Candidatus Tectomicrobia bacterium]
MSVPKLSHVDADGKARMVDVGQKRDTAREARARGIVQMQKSTLELIQRNAVQKGDVLAVAKLAGIMAAKRTSELIPLCHPLPLTSVDLSFHFDVEAGQLDIESVARVTGKTGVEMEALTAVAAAALTVYDMCKAVDRGMCITNVRLIEKRGGQSGLFRRPGEAQ